MDHHRASTPHLDRPHQNRLLPVVAVALALVMAMPPIAGIARSATPAASPVAASPVAHGCDFTTWPLMLMANEFPLDVYSIMVTDAGELKMNCPGEGVQTLATSVLYATESGVPETIQLMMAGPGTPVGPGMMRTSVLFHLPTGKQLSYVPAPYLSTGQMFPIMPTLGPWLVGFLNASETELSVINVRTLEHEPISALMGPEAEAFPSAIAISSADQRQSVIAFGDPISAGSTLSLRALAVGDTFDSAHEIALGQSALPVTDLLLSPDGGHLLSLQGSQTPAMADSGPTILQVIELETNETVLSLENEGTSEQGYAWKLDGTTLLVANGKNLSAYELESDWQPKVVSGDVTNVSQVLITRDPNVVVVVQEPFGRSQAFRLDLASGASARLGMSSGPVMRPSSDVLGVIFVSGPLMTEVRAVDPVSMEVVKRFPVNPTNMTSSFGGMACQSQTAYMCPSFARFGDSPAVLIASRSDSVPMVVELPSEPDQGFVPGTMRSMDGRYLILYMGPPTAGRGPSGSWLLDLESSDLTWVEID